MTQSNSATIKRWDNRWLDMCEQIAGWSKDRSRKVGAVIVGSRNELLSIGWNGFPRGVDDDVECRHDRPEKYAWTVHAETNAIFNAASQGVKLAGSTIYVGGDVTWPCAGCAGAIVQSGITCVVANYFGGRMDDHVIAETILQEGGVIVVNSGRG